MSATATIIVDGEPHTVAADLSVAAALINLGMFAFRQSLGGGTRAPLCAMGTCFECRVIVDGVAGTRACIEPVRDGISVRTAL